MSEVRTTEAPGTSDPKTGGAAAAPAANPANPAAAGTPPNAGGTNAGGTPALQANILASDPARDQPVAAPAEWPNDWRERMAGDDAKMLARLKRYANPMNVGKAFHAAELKISAGQQRNLAPPAEATPEELTLWRKEVGLPDKPEGYLDALDKGLVIGDADKETINGFLGKMHEAHAPASAVKQAVEWYYDNFEKMEAKQAEDDMTYQRQGEDELRQEWPTPGEYRRNVTIINSWLDTAPEGVKDALVGARTADGRPIASNPSVLRFFLSSALEANPAASVVPGAGAAAGVGIEERIEAIQKMMRDPKSDYFKNEKVQAEYRDLIDARERLNAKRAA